jgi:hypothetical protein
MYSNIDSHDVLDKRLVVKGNNAMDAILYSINYLIAWANDTIIEENKKTRAVYRNTLVYPKTDREPKIYIQTVAKIYLLEGENVEVENLWLVIYHIV